MGKDSNMVHVSGGKDTSKKVIKVCIFGDKEFNNYSLLSKKCDEALQFIKGLYRIVVVSGCEEGTDIFGQRYAKENGYSIEYYPSKLENTLTNNTIVQVSNVFLGFCNGSDSATKHMISLIEKTDKPLHVVRY